MDDRDDRVVALEPWWKQYDLGHVLAFLLAVFGISVIGFGIMTAGARRLEATAPPAWPASANCTVIMLHADNGVGMGTMCKCEMPDGAACYLHRNGVSCATALARHGAGGER